MTLTETLNVTGASDLPFLERDPILVGAGAGAVLLLDGKNSFTWNPTLGGVIAASAPLRSLVRSAVFAAADGTTPGDAKWGSQTLTTNLNPLVAPININTTTGRITFPATTYASSIMQSTRTLTSQTLGRYLLNGNDNFCMSMWLFHAGDATSRVALSVGPGTLGSTREGIRMDLRQTGWQIRRPAAASPVAFPTNAGTNVSSIQPNFAYGGALDSASPTISSGIHRFGYAWYKRAGAWFSQPCTNQIVGTELANNGFDTQGIDLGQTTHNGTRDPLWQTHIGGMAAQAQSPMWGTSNAWLRIYIENMTLSGRTQQQIWDADWARANGRFS